MIMTEPIPDPQGTTNSHFIQFGDPDLADILLKCGEKTWTVHSYVVCTKSNYLKFARARAPVDNGFRFIQLPDNNHPPTIHRALEHAYYDDYDDEEDFSVKHSMARTQSPELALVSGQEANILDSTTASTSDKTESSSWATALESQDHTSSYVIQRLMNNLNVYVVAELFDLVDLKIKVEEKFERLVSEAWELDGFALVVQSVFEIDSKALQQHVTAMCMRHLEPLMGRRDFREVLCQTVALAPDLLARLVDHEEDSRAVSDEELDTMESSHKAELAAMEERYLEQIELLKAEHIQETDDLRRTLTVQLTRSYDAATLTQLEAIIDGHIEKTRGVLFSPHIERKELTLASNHLQSIALTGAYKSLSFEELRMVESRIPNNLPLKLETLIQENISTVSELRSEVSRLSNLLKEETRVSSELDKMVDQLAQKTVVEPSVKKEVDHLREVVRNHGAAELAWKNEINYLKETIRKHSTAETAWSREVNRLNGLLNKHSTAEAALREEVARLNKKFLAFVSEPDRWELCRHCDAEFSGYFEQEKYGDGSKYSFRCSYCRTRHGFLENL